MAYDLSRLMIHLESIWLMDDNDKCVMNAEDRYTDLFLLFRHVQKANSYYNPNYPHL